MLLGPDVTLWPYKTAFIPPNGTLMVQLIMLTTLEDSKVPLGKLASCQTNVLQTFKQWLQFKDRLSIKNGKRQRKCSCKLLMNKSKKNKRSLKCSLEVLQSQLKKSLKSGSTWRRRTCSPVAAVANVPENALMTSRVTWIAQRCFCLQTCTGLRTSVAATKSLMSSSAEESTEKWDNTIVKSTIPWTLLWMVTWLSQSQPNQFALECERKRLAELTIFKIE